MDSDEEVMELVKEMNEEVETFFKEAFVAKSAKVLPYESIQEFDVCGIIEIDTGDHRGIIYSATVRKKQEPQQDNSQKPFFGSGHTDAKRCTKQDPQKPTSVYPEGWTEDD